MGYEKQSILDNYELGGIVGEGSYGTVHKAKNKETGRYVAIKKFIEDDQTTLKIAHREVNQSTTDILEFLTKNFSSRVRGRIKLRFDIGIFRTFFVNLF